MVLDPDPNGNWVEYADAQRTIAELTAQLEAAHTTIADKVKACTEMAGKLVAVETQLEAARGERDKLEHELADMTQNAAGHAIAYDSIKAELTTLRQERDEIHTILETMMVSLEEAGFKQPTHTLQLKAALAELQSLRAALESIAKNTCCGPCQEAALVAQHALATRQATPEEGAIMSWIQRQYSPPEGFTADEIKRNLHTVYIDLECSVCGYVISMANNSGTKPCRCGGYDRDQPSDQELMRLQEAGSERLGGGEEDK
jgi:hypothetical protein